MSAARIELDLADFVVLSLVTSGQVRLHIRRLLNDSEVYAAALIPEQDDAQSEVQLHDRI